MALSRLLGGGGQGRPASSLTRFAIAHSDANAVWTWQAYQEKGQGWLASPAGIATVWPEAPAGFVPSEDAVDAAMRNVRLVRVRVELPSLKGVKGMHADVRQRNERAVSNFFHVPEGGRATTQVQPELLAFLQEEPRRLTLVELSAAAETREPLKAQLAAIDGPLMARESGESSTDDDDNDGTETWVLVLVAILLVLVVVAIVSAVVCYWQYCCNGPAMAQSKGRPVQMLPPPGAPSLYGRVGILPATGLRPYPLNARGLPPMQAWDVLRRG